MAALFPFKTRSSIKNTYEKKNGSALFHLKPVILKK